MTAEKLMEAIHKVEIPRPYRMYPDEMIAIAQANDGKLFCVANDVFRYGFLKGQRAARAEAKRETEERRQDVRKGAPGYELLAALIKKNKGNERYVKIVTRFALSMDGGVDAGVDKSE